MDDTFYNSLTDEELISRYRGGDDLAIDFLIRKYKELVLNKARTMYILGGDSDDLIQEGMAGLFKAVRDYDSGRDASFRTFARLCITRQLYKAVEASGRKKHFPLNSAISLSLSVHEKTSEGEECSILDLIAASPEYDPEALMIEREETEDLEMFIERELSPFEKQVLDLHCTGLPYTEIAHVLNRDEKAADNALQRIRTKLRNFRSMQDK